VHSYYSPYKYPRRPILKTHTYHYQTNTTHSHTHDNGRGNLLSLATFLCSVTLPMITDCVVVLQKKKTGGGNGNKENQDGTTTVVLKLDFHCDGCASKITRHLRAFQGFFSLFRSYSMFLNCCVFLNCFCW